MEIALNREQIKGLASFFFDIAKGSMIGGSGFAYIIPSEIRLLTLLASVVIGLVCVKFALKILSMLK